MRALTSTASTRLKRLANCAMAVDSLIGGWTVIDPQRIDPEVERVYQAWLKWNRRSETIKPLRYG